MGAGEGERGGRGEEAQAEAAICCGEGGKPRQHDRRMESGPALGVRHQPPRRHPRPEHAGAPRQKQGWALRLVGGWGRPRDSPTWADAGRDFARPVRHRNLPFGGWSEHTRAREGSDPFFIAKWGMIVNAFGKGFIPHDVDACRGWAVQHPRGPAGWVPCPAETR
jgi:hypothetical protein